MKGMKCVAVCDDERSMAGKVEKGKPKKWALVMREKNVGLVRAIQPSLCGWMAWIE